jgi:Rne/Rng family ribonuclease
MKGHVIVLSAQPRGAALVIDGRIEDLLVATDGPRTPLPGEIHMAAVERLIPAQKAAFVTLGEGAKGYLREARDLRSGQKVPVQIVSVPESGKAIPVTTRLLVKGRLAILTPGAPGVNVSRQIRHEEERARLTAAIAAPDAETGVILRSAAEGASETVILAEIALLAARLAVIRSASGTPGLIGQASCPVAEALREWSSPLPQEIVAPAGLAAALLGPDEALFCADPELAQRLRSETGDPFDRFGVHAEIAALARPEVDLPSGGMLCIEPTRALVAVDVNTAATFSPGAALSANLETARELPRQLRLRGLGGIVIVDWAPVPKKDRKRLEDALKTSFRRDPVETTLAGWTPLGSFEIQRKRERLRLAPG